MGKRLAAKYKIDRRLGENRTAVTSLTEIVSTLGIEATPPDLL